MTLVVKILPANARDARDMSLIPGSGRSPGMGKGNLLQYFSLENSMKKELGRLLIMELQRVRHD